jgi:hypothetical protein
MLKHLPVLTRLARLARALKSRGDQGVALAEYAVGVLLVTGFGFVIFKLIQSGQLWTFVAKFAGQFFNIMSGLWPF